MIAQLQQVPSSGLVQASLSLAQAQSLLGLDRTGLLALAQERRLRLVPADDGLRVDRASAAAHLASRLGASDLAARRSTPRPLQVLLADDDAVARTYFAQVIERFLPGALVTCVADSEGAFSLLQEFVPDVVVTDLSMPSDGFRLAWWLHLSPGYACVQAIALTGLDLGQVREAGGLPPFMDVVRKDAGPQPLLLLLIAGERVADLVALAEPG